MTAIISDISNKQLKVFAHHSEAYLLTIFFIQILS